MLIMGNPQNGSPNFGNPPFRLKPHGALCLPGGWYGSLGGWGFRGLGWFEGLGLGMTWRFGVVVNNLAVHL